MSLETYLEELADPTRPLVVSKLVNLSNLGADEAPLFFDAWVTMGDERRRTVIRRLAEIAEDNVELNFDAAFLFALADDDAQVRREAISALWEYEGHDLIDPLLGLLQDDPDAAVRAEAARALGRYVLQAEFDSLRASDAERVERALQRTVEDQDEVSEVRGRALEAVGARSAAWVHDLIERAYEDPDRRLRLSAVQAMGRSCDPEWLTQVLAELESDDDEMRFEAAIACGAIADERATPYLLPLLDDEDVEVQQAAIGALGEIGGPAAREALERVLEQGSEGAREAALAALAEADFADDPLGVHPRGAS